MQVCSCPAGYEGDPYTGCTADPCSVNPCGANARCERSGETNSPRMQNIPGDLFDNFLTQRLHPSLDIQNAVPGCLMILCFFFYPATAWPCLLGGPPSPVSLNAVIIDARLSRGGPSFNPSSIISSPIVSYFFPLGNRAICKCPDGYTGDPFVRCNADPCSQVNLT